MRRTSDGASLVQDTMGWKSKLAVACVFSVAFAASASAGERPAVEAGRGVAMLHFGGGRQTLSFRLHERAGTIRLYTITAPSGSWVRGYAQLRGLTVPLRIATRPVGPSSGCARHGDRVTCTVGEEGCPMPAADWSFRFDKVRGPAGDVVVRFRVA